MRKALFPGTFDPPTHGHLDLIRRGAAIFDLLIVGIGENSAKLKSMLSVQQRLEGLKEELSSLSNVKVIAFSGLATQFAKDQQIETLLRGIRSPADMEYEMQMARANHTLSGVETLFLLSDSSSQGISSTLIRELALHKAPLDHFIPKRFERMIYN